MPIVYKHRSLGASGAFALWALFASPAAAQSPGTYAALGGWQGTDGPWALADVTGDGYSDFISLPAIAPQAVVDPSRGDGTLHPGWGWQYGNQCNGARCPLQFFADVNGDKRMDLVALAHGARDQPNFADAWVWLSRSATSTPATGGSFAAAERWTDNFCDNSQDCTAADVNGDGKADLVAFTPDFGLVWVSLSTGNGFAAPEKWQNYFCIRGEQCTLADVNGDGRADLVLFKPHATGAERGNVLVAFSNGTSFDNPVLGHGQFCVDDQPCFIADINGDKRADLVSAKRYLKPNSSVLDHTDLLMSISNGSTFTNIPFQTILEEGHLAAIANVYGDARPEIVWAGEGDHSRSIMYFTPKTGASTDPSTPPPPPPSDQGVSTINVYNCNPHTYPDSDENRRVDLWLGTPAGYVNIANQLDAQYNADHLCPYEEDGTFAAPAASISLSGRVKDGELVDVLVLDRDMDGCDGQNEPSVASCVYYKGTFRYKSNGALAQVTVGQ